MISVLATYIVLQQTRANSTPDVLSQPKALASESNRYVFVVFTATWCKSCKELRGILSKPAFQKLFAKKFVVAYVDVSDKSKVDNLALRRRYCTDQAPMPSYAIVDSKGRLIANGFGNSSSSAHRAPLSYPLTRANIGDFLRMLNRVPKGINMDTLWKLRAELEKEVK